MSIWGKSWGISGGGGGTDTGLGWYADSAWLTDQTGDIGEISTPGGHGDFVEVPHVTGTGTGTSWWLSVASNGLEVAEGAVYGYSTGKAVIMNAPSDAAHDKNFYLFRVGTNIYAIRDDYEISFNTSDGTSLLMGYYNDSFTQLYNGVAIGQNSMNVYGTIYYYHTVPQWPGDVTLNQSIPVFDSILAGVYAFVGAISGTVVDFQKSSLGYSVVCMCKWNATIGGDTYCSPVLISSNSSYTAFTKDSTAITSPTSYTYDGMTFYMLKDTSTTLDGTETITAYVPELDLTSRGPMADMGIFYAVINAAGLGVS